MPWYVIVLLITWNLLQLDTIPGYIGVGVGMRLLVVVVVALVAFSKEVSSDSPK